jgi:lipid-binding SYLF domain-containing protein
MRRPLIALILLSLSTLAGLSLAPTASATSPSSDEDELLRKATLVFARAVNTPAAAIPAAVLMRASGIAVIPAAAKDGTRYYGNGVVSARGARPDYWTPPAVIAFEGAIPLDLETGSLDFVFIAQSRRGLDWLVDPRTTSTTAHAMAAGGLGHNTPIRINADLLAYMQFENYFAGVTVDDWIVHEMKAANETLYGRRYSTDDIVRGVGFFHVPRAARMWRDAIADYYRDMS